MTSSPETANQRTIDIETDDATLEATLHLVDEPAGLVVFPDGIGAGQLRSRNWFVAGVVREAGFATLVVDLLTEDQKPLGASDQSPEFDVEQLADRLVGVLDWLETDDDVRHLDVGLFGASLGATAALLAAARRPDIVDGLVCRGARSDLAGDELAKIEAPTLLLVGSNDFRVIELNEKALDELGADDTRMGLISGASHLFSEPGTLQRAAELGADWLQRHISPSASAASAP